MLTFGCFLIKLLTKRLDQSVEGDLSLGCGEDLLGQQLDTRGQIVHSFDHVSINANVTAVDMRRRSVIAAALVDYRLMPQDQDRKKERKPNINLREPLAPL